MKIRLILSSLAASAALCAMPGTTRAQIFVTNFNNGNFNAGTVGEYTTSGLGPVVPGIAVSGDKLFVSDEVSGLIAEYTTSGATVNPNLITGLTFPEGIVVFGGNLFVTSFGTLGSANGTIGEYTTSGATV